jgi:hypothetical protein
MKRQLQVKREKVIERMAKQARRQKNKVGRELEATEQTEKTNGGGYWAHWQEGVPRSEAPAQIKSKKQTQVELRSSLPPQFWFNPTTLRLGSNE